MEQETEDFIEPNKVFFTRFVDIWKKKKVLEAERKALREQSRNLTQDLIRIINQTSKKKVQLRIENVPYTLKPYRVNRKVQLKQDYIRKMLMARGVADVDDIMKDLYDRRPTVPKDELKMTKVRQQPPVSVINFDSQAQSIRFGQPQQPPQQQPQQQQPQRQRQQQPQQQQPQQQPQRQTRDTASSRR